MSDVIAISTELLKEIKSFLQEVMEVDTGNGDYLEDLASDLLCKINQPE